MAASFNPPFDPASLSKDQQELLMAALASNIPPEGDIKPPTRDSFDFSSGSLSSPMFPSGQFDAAFANVDFSSMDDQQFMELLGNNAAVDFDAIAPEDTLNENEESPTSPIQNEYDLHDKRKNSEDGAEAENTPKRRESEEKTTKKPGRKPLTSEPTSVSLQPLLDAQILTSARNERRKIGPLNAPSVSERKSIC
jgi:AP-1-like transcription factor